MDQMRGVLRIAVFRMNLLTRREGQEDVSLRILADPDVPPCPVLRLRQDRRMEIPSGPEFSGKPEPVAGQNVPEPLVPKDPRAEQPGPMLCKD